MSVRSCTNFAIASASKPIKTQPDYDICQQILYLIVENPFDRYASLRLLPENDRVSVPYLNSFVEKCLPPPHNRQRQNRAILNREMRIDTSLREYKTRHMPDYRNDDI